MKQLSAIVLAAGRGVRMRSPQAKVLEPLGDKPLIHYVLRELKGLACLKQIIVVVGYQAEAVKRYIKANFRGVEFVYQKGTLGTAHAVSCAKSKVRCNDVLILCGDAPLITKKTLSAFISFYTRSKPAGSLLTAHLTGPNQLGVICRDSKGQVAAIREKVDFKAKALGHEANSGIYLFNKKLLFNNIAKIKKHKRKGEYFLTDIVDIYYKQGLGLRAYCLDDSDQILGINTRRDLCSAEAILRERIIDQHLERGVRIIDPQSTFIAEGVKIGKNTLIYPFTFIEKDVIIGSNCLLGPFLRLRKGTRIKSSTRLGNFIEVNRSVLGPAVTMKHFGYLGDTSVAQAANIGAGAVVANYDGKKKHKSVIGRGSFIGCDTVLVAPVKVGEQAITGAGSVVTKDVKAKTVVAGVPAKQLKSKGRS